MGDSRRLYNGTVTAILRPTGVPGKVTVKAVADGMKPAVTVIDTKESPDAVTAL